MLRKNETTITYLNNEAVDLRTGKPIPLPDDPTLRPFYPTACPRSLLLPKRGPDFVLVLRKEREEIVKEALTRKITTRGVSKAKKSSKAKTPGAKKITPAVQAALAAMAHLPSDVQEMMKKNLGL